MSTVKVEYTIYPDATVGLTIPPTPNISYGELCDLIFQLRKIREELAPITAKAYNDLQEPL